MKPPAPTGVVLPIPPEVAESLAHYAELAGEVRNGLSALVALGRKLQVDAARAKKSKRRKG